MSMKTSFTESSSLRHPVALAPMGGVAGGTLTAAVSNGGGLGLVGGGGGNQAWLQNQLKIVAYSTSEPWGVGFLSWALEAETLEWILRHRPMAVMLSFGDPGPFVDMIRAAGMRLSNPT
jgi:nitronate monooxygenase